MPDMGAEFVVYYYKRDGDSLLVSGRCQAQTLRVGDVFTAAYNYRIPGKRERYRRLNRRNAEVTVNLRVESIAFLEVSTDEQDEPVVRCAQSVEPGQGVRLTLHGEGGEWVGERDVLGIANA